MTEQASTPSSPKTPLGILGIGVGFLFLLLLPIRWISQGTFWTHLVTGRFIAENGIPRADALSLTADGAPWVAGSWLFDLILVQLWKGGPTAVILVHTIVVVVAFALLARASRAWASATAIGCGLLLSGWLLAPVLDVAPKTFALLFPALFIFLLNGNRSPMLLWPAILIGQVLWTNIHGSFLLGPAICLASAFGHHRLGPSTETGGPTTRTFLLLAVGALAVTLLNPYGPGLHLAVLGSTSDPAGVYLATWISPVSNLFGSTLAKNLTTLALAIGAAGLLLYKEQLPISITAVAVIGAAIAVILGLQIQIFAVLAFPYFCLSFDAFGKAIRGFLERVSEPAAQASPWMGVAAVTLLGLLSCGLIITNTYYRSIGSLSAFGLGSNEDLFPAEARKLIAHPDFPERSFNQPFDGSYLAWAYPERKIFIDTRPGIYSTEVIQSIQDLTRGEAEGTAAFMEEWKPDAFILNALLPDTPAIALPLLRSGDWALAYFDGTTLILVRDIMEFAEVVSNSEAQRHGLQILETERDDYRDAIGSPLGAPISPRLLGAASVFYHLQRFPEAEAAYELLLLNAPSFRSGYIPFGVAQLQSQHGDAAVETLVQATQIMPKNPLAFMWLGEAHKAAGHTELADRAFNRAKLLDPELARQIEARNQKKDAAQEKE